MSDAQPVRRSQRFAYGSISDSTDQSDEALPESQGVPNADGSPSGAEAESEAVSDPFLALLRSLFPQSERLFEALNAQFPHMFGPPSSVEPSSSHDPATASQPQAEPESQSQSQSQSQPQSQFRFRFIPLNFNPFSMDGSLGGGILGDYALNQRSFDDIITHLMNQESLRYMPAVATDEMIANLTRISLTDDIKSTHHQCIICREDYAEAQQSCGDQDAPSAHVSVIQLGCKHVFHEECIISWLKNNGTCPICRFSVNKEFEESVKARTVADGDATAL